MPLSSRIHAAPRGHLWSALGVALAAVGCAPPGPRAASSLVEAMRTPVAVKPPLDLTLSVLRSGDTTGPRVILVHGTPGTAASWADYLLAPPPGVEVLAIDRPGFGLSGPAHALPKLADQAAAVRALLPADGRPVVLLGHSLGGPVVARVAAMVCNRSMSPANAITRSASRSTVSRCARRRRRAPRACAGT